MGPATRRTAPAPGSGPRSRPWLAMVREIEQCRRCPLGGQRTRVVVYRGAARPAIVFVGEAPGRLEDLSGRPFVGRAGHRLDAAVARLGLSADQWGVLNVVKCHPPGNRLGAEPLKACRPFLDRQLTVLHPRLLVPLGARALKALDAAAPSISDSAGMPRSAGGRWLFPLLHPAAGFRSRWAAARWEQDVDRLRAWLEPRLETL